MNIVIQLRPDPRHAKTIEDKLTGFNKATAPGVGVRDVLITAEVNTHPVGGVLAMNEGGWMFVHALWVDESLRGRGIGTQLMRALEGQCPAQGCHSVHTDTFTFQALPFYEGLGYEVFGILEGYADGNTRYYLRKRLT